ncbi:hypothetical protein MA16_Dca020002 [Dendrobium catenatum]|uniref:Uncharacterized protein n=1 Tax=Dendrobium catenatum TaxID=906689 RepID=A0A2I0XF61_9ASPA|nr:hypothetical protein MA16_Dca020002 [Dendrobium catenatum]
MSSTPTTKSCSSSNPNDSFHIPFISKINFRSLWNSLKKWIKRPKHIALFIWSLFVASGLIILALLMTGILNKAIPSNNRRKHWSEIINQVLNALFTIIAIYEHPKFFLELILLLRWRDGDEIELKKVYAKNGVSKPNERKHMMIVVILLHITCFAQYVLCGLYWFYTSTTRPNWALNLSIGIGTAAPIIVVLYTRYGPLYRTNEEDEEIVFLAFPCTFYVFGWNMERLGFGNKFVHIIKFKLVCISPFLIFYITFLKVIDDKIKLILVIIGGILCVFGSFYGGFWRTKMRKKFKLHGYSFCCGSSTITDYIQWLFCWSCSLAQEVRTANFYDIEKDGFYEKVIKDGQKPVLILVPLESEGNKSILRDCECSYQKNILFVLPNKVMGPPLSPIINVEEELFVSIEL